MAWLNKYLFLAHTKSDGSWWGLFFVQLQRHPSSFSPLPLNIDIWFPRLSCQEKRKLEGLASSSKPPPRNDTCHFAYGPLARISNMTPLAHGALDIRWGLSPYHRPLAQFCLVLEFRSTYHDLLYYMCVCLFVCCLSYHVDSNVFNIPHLDLLLCLQGLQWGLVSSKDTMNIWWISE